MSLDDHHRRPGYIAAWKQIGLRQTLGPHISRRRLLWTRSVAKARMLLNWMSHATSIISVRRSPLRLVQKRSA